MTTYTAKTLEPFAAAIATAQGMQTDDAKSCRDEGTCVMGAGIAVWYTGPRQRKARRHILISQAFQGNSGSWKAAQRALEYLKSQGLDCRWDDGMMD